jgi:hypothetical protein
MDMGKMVMTHKSGEAVREMENLLHTEFGVPVGLDCRTETMVNTGVFCITFCDEIIQARCFAFEIHKPGFDKILSYFIALA